MSVSREIFYDTISEMRSLASDALLTDVFPPNASHNNRAIILRSGLTVSAFSHFETYLEGRIEEILISLPQSKISYNLFDEPLKRFFSVDAINGLSKRINFIEKSDRRLYAETHLSRIAALLTTPSIFTGLGFGAKGSNVLESDIAETLKYFGIQDPWRKLEDICRVAGAARISLSNDFRNFSKTRNNCAHDSNTNLPTGDLITHIETALLLGMAFDIAMTHAVECLVKASSFGAAKTKALFALCMGIDVDRCS